MRDLIFVAYIAIIMLMAFKRPFLFTLVYAYVDIVSPQRLSYFLLNSVPLSLILFALARAATVRLFFLAIFDQLSPFTTV